VTHRGRRPGWWRSAILCSVALGALVADCAAAGATTTTTTTSPPVTYVGVAGRSVSFGMTQSPSGCNPHTTAGDTPATQLVLNAVLPSPFFVNASGVVEQNANLLVGNQAELVSTKPETIVYTLNPKAVWSDGVPITAKDFIYAWTQQRGDPTSDPTTVASTAGYRDIRSVKGSDNGRTVTVIFRTPFADWEMLFSDLLPAHIMEKAGWNPACATVSQAIDLSGGPFRIAKVTAQSIVLRANPKWWGTKPNSRRINVDIAADSTQLAQWVSTGHVQVALPSDLTPSFLDEMTSLPGVQSQIALSGTILEMEMASGPDSVLSPDMRLAIALSVDREALTTRQADWALSSVQVATSHMYAQGETGYHTSPTTTPTTTPSAAPTTSTSTSTTVIDQGGMVNFPVVPSPTEASDLMAASGYFRTGTGTWHNDFSVPLTLTLAVDESDPWAASVAPQLQSQLESAGFTVTLTPERSAAAAGELLAGGTADVALIPRTTSPFLSDSVAWYSDLLGSPGQNGSQNWTNYDNGTFANLVTQASEQLNKTTATTEYQAADVQLWNDLVALPLFTEPSALISSRKVGYVTATPTSNSLLWYAQYWDVRVPEATSNTTPSLPGP
jgi:peptide/nickel transport system substrate-binding protein